MTNGPCFRPLPGEDDVGDADEQASTVQRSGAKLGEEPQHRRERERGAFGVLHRERLRRDLADHEEQHDLQHDADDDARRPAAPSSSTPMSVAVVSCDTSTSSSTELSVCSGRSSMPRADRAALVALVGQRDRADATHAHERGLGAAKKIDRMNNTTTTAR